MKEGIFAKRDREGTLWIYLWFEGEESLLGYLTKNTLKEQERIQRFIEKQKEVGPGQAVATR